MSGNWLRAEWPAPGNIVAGTTLKGSEDFEFPAEPQWLNQVHGATVVVAGSSDFDDGAPSADAIISSRAGELCAVRTADCLPILLCARDGSEVAAVHAGWRGLAAGVVEATIHRMAQDAEALVAWIGPAISQAAFEVGHEVRDSFGRWGEDERFFAPNERGRLQADLFGLADARLKEMGVRVFGERICTFEDPARFYSYRRDGTTGRHVSFVFRGG